MKKDNWILGLIFLLAILIRFYDFKQSVYFGFDEARDAFVSQAIYRQGDLKLIGPPASGTTGLNHGVLHWYLIGIFYLIGSGSPFFVSGVFRLLNALAVWPIFWITNKLFNRRAAYLASLFFAFSFEASQYALYYGNPSLAVWSWISLFAGATIIYKRKNKFWGLPLMALGIASGAQFELSLVTLFPVGLIILWLLHREIKKISIRSWATAFTVGLLVDSSYILAELKNHFRSIKLIFGLLTTSHGSLVSGANWIIYIKRWLLILHDNFLPINNYAFLSVTAAILLIYLVSQARKKMAFRLMLVWIFGGIFVHLIGTYNAYYINVGIGTGLIIALAVFFDTLMAKSKFWALALVALPLAGNLSQILTINKGGLIQDIKTQQFMQLTDEVQVINKMYAWADGKPFTIRVTSMPYEIQTVWAYLFDLYGKPHYGYLPYYETGNVLGYPGYLPQPKNGTTCIRFLLREPLGGIPMSLVEKDISDENYFSKTEETVRIGQFFLEKRVSTDKKCFVDNFPN